MTNFIDYDLFKRTIEYLVSQEGIEEISISGGEPFLHKDLLKIIKLCKSYDIKTNLYTSGIVLNRLKEIEIDYEVLTYNERFIIEEMKKQQFSFIDKNILKELKEIGLDKLVFDFQASDCDKYNFLMGTKGNMANVLHSIINAKSVGLYTEIHFIPMRVNYKDIEDILELCEIGEIDKVSILKFVPQGRGKENQSDLQLSIDELRTFCENVDNLRSKYKINIRMGIPLTNESDHLCTAGCDKFAIRYDGVVLPCVAFKESDKEELANKLGYRVFTIQDGLNKLQSRDGINNCALCKKVYG